MLQLKLAIMLQLIGSMLTTAGGVLFFCVSANGLLGAGFLLILGVALFSIGRGLLHLSRRPRWRLPQEPGLHPHA